MGGRGKRRRRENDMQIRSLAPSFPASPTLAQNAPLENSLTAQPWRTRMTLMKTQAFLLFHQPENQLKEWKE